VVPVPRWEPLARHRLLGLLDEGAKGPLTLVAAPAGYGKTLLLSSWATAGLPPGPLAWVRVGPGDQHPPRFWAQVLASLRVAGVAGPEGPLAGLDPRPDDGDELVHSLAGGLAELDRPVVLVLDDLHEAAGQAVAGQLRSLLRHAPPQLRLVVATRADPPLALHRLRVAGQLTEVREAELAFTLEEAGALLADHGVELSGAELETLWRRTEGWAAGLRLAALSLRAHPRPGRFVADLAGDDRAVAGYLVEEVLAAQPPELRAFLLRTSIADRLCGELADALTGGSDGARVLHWLEREHVFTTAIGPNRAWYRYHPLFAELLRAELRYEHAAELPELHRRAAGWYAANGQPVPAVRHALAGGDLDQAAALLAASWAPMLAEGQAFVLEELVSRLGGERVRSTPELAVVAALGRLALGELEEADAWLGMAAAAEPRLAREREAGTGGRGQQRPGGRHPGTGAALHVAGLYRARLVGEVADAGPAARALLAPGGVATRRVVGDDDQQALALALLGGAQLWSGQLDDAGVSLERARADAEGRGREMVALAATAHLALLEAVRGRLGRAGELARLAAEQAARADWSANPQLACADLAVAICAYHRDDLAAASAALDRAGRGAAPGDRPLLLAVAILAAWLAAGTGPADARAALARLDGALGATVGRPPRLLRSAARAARAKLLATLGDESAASAALDGDDGPPVEAVVSARLHLARGDPAGAVRAVAPLLPGGPSQPEAELPLAIEACLVDAVANHELADRATAVRSLGLALDLAAPEGYRRVFVEGGTPVRALLADHLHWDGSHHALVDSLLERLRASASAGAHRPGPGGQDSAPAPLVVPLSEREQVVLRYLSSRLSAGEIADELYVSLNTVKTHIKSIYRKLDANRRWDAVKRARQLQLL
jgi:LuxR family transcriptional regulator, maltose regulon positive regulatory protein